MTSEYLHVSSIGQEYVCQSIRNAISVQLDNAHKSAIINGYWLAFVDNEDAIQEKFIPEECLELTNNQFPFLYLRVNYIDGHAGNNSILTSVTNAGFVQIF